MPEHSPVALRLPGLQPSSGRHCRDNPSHDIFFRHIASQGWCTIDNSYGTDLLDSELPSG
ncbi:TPA: hypothetical protein I8271_002903 [Kluyvera intermedia]|uniref:Uncharacterized protein n=1 Tax=Kluyvera intermedia TaxID=61648 RepID=A0A9P3TA97_KLUIN|nr:hypothetical protein [Phytobacter ursingii]HAT2205706.1 hypothetical protein [Kluyvera intermedia]HAT2516432.1 hypothetical protein [Kluyvera intermedia]HAT2604177.1 hypothetical protein [Kluyvera intermedia]HAT2681152.1 hypothetical protein [Kluyvera intermedia]HAT2697534.1 hypothetical protein [Kluyvera intermedia]